MPSLQHVSDVYVDVSGCVHDDHARVHVVLDVYVHVVSPSSDDDEEEEEEEYEEYEEYEDEDDLVASLSAYYHASSHADADADADVVVDVDVDYGDSLQACSPLSLSRPHCVRVWMLPLDVCVRLPTLLLQMVVLVAEEPVASASPWLLLDEAAVVDVVGYSLDDDVPVVVAEVGARP